MIRMRMMAAASVAAVIAALPAHAEQGAERALDRKTAAVAAAHARGSFQAVPGHVAPTDSIRTGSYLARVLARVSRGLPVEVDVRVEIVPPEPYSPAVYAARYGIPAGLARQIIETASSEGIDPDLGFRLVRVESVFRPRARGPQGALGLTQVMPSTARFIDRNVRTEAEMLEPATNLRLGFRYLRWMIERYDGDVRLGLLAYNRGQTAVDRALRAGRDPENGYSRLVLGTRGGGGREYEGPGLLQQ